MKISDLSFEKINSSTGRTFILEHHYSGSCHNGPMCWGIWYKKDKWHRKDLCGVCAFATPISERVRKNIWKEEYEEEMKNYTTELHRLVTLDKCPKNTESWFISRALKGLKEYKNKYRAVISHADPFEGHKGTIYQATNAMYYGKGSPQRAYIDSEGNLRSQRQNGKNISVSEAEERGWEETRREGKHRYLYILPDDTYNRKEIKKRLSIEEKPYP